MYEGQALFIIIIFSVCAFSTWGSYNGRTECFVCFFMAGCTLLIAKKIMNNNPYVSLTDSVLVLYVLREEPVETDWNDIQDYIFYEIHSNKFIGLVLQNEGKYRERIPKKNEEVVENECENRLSDIQHYMGKFKRKRTPA
jgi:hypothetical protein